MKKTMHLLIGCPGSGKSHTAKTISSHIYSTDEFWGPDYAFDRNKLKEAHEWNQNRVKMALQEGLNPIVVDNTNITRADRSPYIKMAVEHGYSILFKFPDSPWWTEMFERVVNKTFTDADVELLFNKNTHRVPKDVIENMMYKFEL